MNTGFSFLRHNFTDTGFILNVDLSVLSVWLSLPLWSGGRSPFHLKETLYGLSLVCPNGQHHYFSALGSLLGKIRVTGTQDVWCMTVPLIIGVATKFLIRERAGQMEESCSGQERMGQPELSSVPRKGMQFKNDNLCISGIFLFTFLDHSCL